MYTISMYLCLIGSVGFLYYGIFKIDYKSEKLRLWKILIITLSINGLLISFSSIMALEDTLFYKIISYGGMFIMFALFSVIGWKLTKVPKTRGYAIAGLVIYAITIIFIIIVVILAKLGFFG